MKYLTDYKLAYDSGSEPEAVLRQVWETIRDEPDEGIFITKASWECVADQLSKANRQGPLFGIPYAVKDNIDVAQMPTTAACPAFAYVPEQSAKVVDLLQQAGAICMGKTNLDQFATGLVGIRTPYPIPKNAIAPEYLPGGSSAGSAVALAKQLVAFSLGTDTAGSGRVPAAFQELVGLKPSCGYLSTRGVVDACKSLDCVSIFAHSARDAAAVLEVAAQFDADEAWSRRPPSAWPRIGKTFRFGVPKPDALQYFGWENADLLFQQAIEKWIALGGEPVTVDIAPFMEAAKLLYQGPWIAERFVALEEFFSTNIEDVFPVTRDIILTGSKPSAADFFRAQYQLAECKRLAMQEIEQVDFILMPTTPRNFLVSEVQADPIRLNSILGTYTNFMNLLDFSALALPAGRYDGKLPWGITIFGKAGMDMALLEMGARFSELENAADFWNHVSWDQVQLLVFGAHMSGLPLNHQLTSRGGRYEGTFQTADCYRMALIPPVGALPPRPAVYRVESGSGRSMECEQWSLSIRDFGEFVKMIPAPLGIGKIVLSDGTESCGFISEAHACHGANDLTEFGGWRNYLKSIG